MHDSATIDFYFMIFKKPHIHMLANWEKMSMADYVDKELKKVGITLSKPILAVLCITFGILVILFPTLLVWIVGLFLVIQGILFLTTPTPEARRVTGVTSATTPQPINKYCPQCGVELTKEAIFCYNCGKNQK